MCLFQIKKCTRWECTGTVTGANIATLPVVLKLACFFPTRSSLSPVSDQYAHAWMHRRFSRKHVSIRPVQRSDTAGLREATDDEVEREGMRRARGAVDNAHLAIFVVDSTNADGATALLRQLREEAAAAAAEAAATAEQRGDGDGFEGGGKAA